MHDGDPLWRRDRRFESPIQSAHSYVVLLGSDEIPALLPANHLSFDETLWASETAEITASRIDRMELCDGVDQRETKAASHILVGAHGRGDHAANDLALLALHHEEVGVGGFRVVAKNVGAWRPVEDTPQSRQHLELTFHVVGARGDRSERGSTKDELHIVEADQVGEVRCSVWELEDFELALDREIHREVLP